MTDERLKIAVFIDFDNIEIGVKTTLGVHFDIGAILEAIKERGEVITKVAYGDWKRAGDHSRLLTQHAIRMVQRNVTPGGDKNGADINLALDALEMALTHSHINAYVIVGGDSDFISLVEKLKQYDKKVFVVGGRAFTSQIMQKNCYEFIAYENLIAPRPAARRMRTGEKDRGGPAARLDKAMPLIERALQVLADREVSPQLGLLKSTLLQLDSAFSERDFGASSFREFVEKLSQAGLVNLRQAGRSVLVELSETDGKNVAEPAEGTAGESASLVEEAAPAPAPVPPTAARTPRSAHVQQAVPARPPAPAAPAPSAEAEEPGPAAAPEGARPATAAPAASATQSPIEAINSVRHMFESGLGRVRWPMYVRNVKQFVRSIEPGFDERRFGFGGILDLLRGCQREGIFRLERDRQGVLRVFPGPVLQRLASEAQQGPAPERQPALPSEVVAEPEPAPVVVEAEIVNETGVTEPPVEVVQETAGAMPVETPAEGETVGERPAGRSRRRRTPSGPRKAAAPPRKPRAPARTGSRPRKKNE